MPDWTELLTEAERRLQESFSRFHLEAGQPLPPEVQDALLASEEALRTVATLRALVEEIRKAAIAEWHPNPHTTWRACQLCGYQVGPDTPYPGHKPECPLALTEDEIRKRLEENSC